MCSCFQSSQLSNSSFDLTSSLVKVECDPAGQLHEIEVGQEVVDQRSQVNHCQEAEENHTETNGNSYIRRGMGEEEEQEDNRLLPEFLEALPDDWETIEGDRENQRRIIYILLRK